MLVIKSLVAAVILFNIFIAGPQGGLLSFCSQGAVAENLVAATDSFRLLLTGNNYTPDRLPNNIYKDENTLALEKLVIPWLYYYTNLYRKEHGIDTLKYDGCLLKAAAYHTDYLFNESKETKQFKLGHQQEPRSKWFKGKSPSDRALAAGCQKYCGENALYMTLPDLQTAAYSDSQQLNLVAKKMARDMVFDQWHHSKGHRQNMLTRDYTSLGVAVAIGKQALKNTYRNGQLFNPAAMEETNSGNMIVFGVQVMAY